MYEYLRPNDAQALAKMREMSQAFLAFAKGISALVLSLAGVVAAVRWF